MNERQTITALIIAVVVGLVCVTVTSANRYHSIETWGDVREKSLGHPLLMKNDTDLETVTLNLATAATVLWFGELFQRESK